MAKAIARQQVDMRSALDVVDSPETFQQLIAASTSGEHQFFEVAGGLGLSFDVTLNDNGDGTGSVRFNRIELHSDSSDEESPILWQLGQVPLVAQFELTDFVETDPPAGTAHLSLSFAQLLAVDVDFGFADPGVPGSYYLIGSPSIELFDGAAGFDGSFVPYVLRLSDAITGSAADDFLIGFAGNDTMKGGLGSDALRGEKGNDVLHGGKGNDELGGGLGSDLFVFDAARNAATNKDTILDFRPGTDRIALDADIFSVLEPGDLGASFKVGLALQPDDYILYTKSTGVLSYDADGSGPGAATPFAVVGTATHPVLGAADFQVVA